jgi:hypothetical protein
VATSSEYARTAVAWRGRANKFDIVKIAALGGVVPIATVIPIFTTGNVHSQ